MRASTRLWSIRALGSGTQLRLFDLAGRTLRTLTIFAGQRFGVWGDRDPRGESVASGTYFAQVLDRPEAAVGRIVLLREGDRTILIDALFHLDWPTDAPPSAYVHLRQDDLRRLREARSPFDVIDVVLVTLST